MCIEQRDVRMPSAIAVTIDHFLYWQALQILPRRASSRGYASVHTSAPISQCARDLAFVFSRCIHDVPCVNILLCGVHGKKQSDQDARMLSPESRIHGCSSVKPRDGVCRFV